LAAVDYFNHALSMQRYFASLIRSDAETTLENAMISRRAFVGGAAISLAAPSVLRAQTPARTLKISHQFQGGAIDQGDFRDRLCRKFAAAVEQRTGGELKFEIYPGSTLMKAMAQFPALRKGALDLSLCPLPYAGAEIPAMNLGLMPLLVTTYEQGAKWKDAPVGQSLSRIAEDKGAKFISWIWQGGALASRTASVKVPDDVKGMKIHGGSREMDLMLAAAGARVSSMPPNDIYASMQSGALDGALTSSTSLMSFQLEDFARALTTARGGSIWFMCEPLLMSKEVFESLTPAQQKAIAEAGEEMEWFATVEAKRDDEAVAKAYAAKGASVAEMTADDLAKWRAIAEESAWKDFASKSAEAAELLASAKSVA
jgi:TRAP-type C4-dicarboxylate transport system substrate-binding protein